MIAFPKPKDIKKKPDAVRIMKDGREICRLNIKAGMDEYVRRKRVMWERQDKRCCLEGLVPCCPGRLNWGEATFEHSDGRGHGGGHRDDRIEVDGKPQNGVSHPQCNIAKSSVRLSKMLEDIVP